MKSLSRILSAAGLAVGLALTAVPAEAQQKNAPATTTLKPGSPAAIAAAKEILTTHLQSLHAMAEALVKYETIDEEQIREIMAGKPPTPPPGWEEPMGGAPTKGGGSTDGRPAFGSPAGQH